LNQIKNISLLQYLELPEGNDYDVYMDILKPVNSFCGGSFDESKLTFDQHHTMISILNKPTLEDIQELFIHLFNIKRKGIRSCKHRFLNESVFTYFRARKVLSMSFETMYLSSVPDPKMDILNACERLAPWGRRLSMIQIGKMFGKFPHEVGNIPYTEVIHSLVPVKIVEDIKFEYSQLK